MAPPGAGRGTWIANAGTLLSAIMASSCCWLPPLLIVFGVSGAGMITVVEAYRPLLMVVTFGFLGMAFYLAYRPLGKAAGAADGDATDCCAPAAAGTRRRFNMMAMNKVMLWAVTVMAVVFLFFPGYVTAWFRPDSGQFTADMDRTVLTVEGMTCPG